MAARTKVFVDITTKTESANKGLAKYAIAAGAAAVAVALLVKVGKDLENTFAVQEQAEARLNRTIIATGKAANLTFKELTDMASGLQDVTKFGDEAIIGAQSLLLTFKNIGGDIFPRALESILDVSEAMGTDLQASTIQLGKALNDPILGLTSLSRAGIQFTEDQKDTIKSMVEMGDKAGAQTIILEELESQFGGVARAAADTASGVKNQLDNSFGDLKETLGGVISEGLRPYREELLKEVEAVNKSVKAHFLRGKVLRGEATVIEELILREIEQEKTEDRLAQAKENLVRAENAEIDVAGVSIGILNMREAALKKGIAQAKLTIAGLEDELTLRKLSTAAAQEQFDSEQNLLDIKLAAFQATGENIGLLGDEDEAILKLHEDTTVMFGTVEGGFIKTTRLIGDQNEAVKDLSATYESFVSAGLSPLIDAFDNVGDAGANTWEVMKQAGKDAISGLLKAFAEMWTVRAVAELAKLNFASAALFTGAAIGATAAASTVQNFATGGSFVTDSPTMVGGSLAGDNASGREQVDITPLGGSGGDDSGTFRLISGDGDMLGWIQRVGIDNGALHSSQGGRI